MHIDLSGKSILVTGASRGIGRAIAESLSSSGAEVVVHCRNKSQEVEEFAKSINSPVIEADLSKVDEVIDLFERTITQLGGLDVLVNNAGIAISSPLSKSEEDWIEDWQRTIQVNLTSASILSKRAIEHYIKNKVPGKIINISSRAAFRGDTAEYLAYAASKGGLVSITKSLARAYGKEGITSFLVAPGFVRTDMAQDFIDQYGQEHAESDVSLSRLTTPHDLTPLITLLASGMADHATGSTFDVNAGSYMH